MYAVLEKDNEKSKYQAFTVRYLQSNASRRRPRQKQRSIVRLHGSGSHGSWGFAENRVFSLKARYSNKVAYIDSKDKNAIKMRSPKRTSDEKFFFDRNTGLIHSAKDSKLAVEMIPAAKGEYKLAAVSFSGKEKDQDKAVFARYGSAIGWGMDKHYRMSSGDKSGAVKMFKSKQPWKNNVW